MTTLVIHTSGTMVEAHGARLTTRTPDGTKRDIPLVNIRRVHCYGRVQCSHAAICLLSESGRELAWFSRGGRLRARVSRLPSRGLDLRRAQYRLADDAGRGIAYARDLIAAKIANQRTVLVRQWRTRPEIQDVQLIARLDQLAANAVTAPEAETLRGIEGTAARIYFTAWAAPLAPFIWNGRNRRPPRDPLNAMLSLGYALLANEVSSQAEAMGYDIWQGVYHGDRAGRPSLALDVMEPLRPVLVDRMITDLVAHHQVALDNFVEQPWQPAPGEGVDGQPEADWEGRVTDPTEDPQTATHLDEKTFRVFITAWERRMSHVFDDDDQPKGGGRHLLNDMLSSLAVAMRDNGTSRFEAFRLKS